MLECSHQEVLSAHLEFDGAKGMLHGLSANAHCFWKVIEPLLHFIQHSFVVPSTYASFVTGRALILQWAILTSVCPISVLRFPILLVARPSGEYLISRATIHIVFCIIDKIIFTESSIGRRS